MRVSEGFGGGAWGRSVGSIWGQGAAVPNFFLMTLRIFFWSNFFGRPWTVVKVLRPLRSAGNDTLACVRGSA